MNVHAMLAMSLILAFAVGISFLATWLQNTFHVSPGWIIAGMFALAIIAIGVIAK